MNHRNFETSLMFRSTLLNMKSVLVPVCKSTDESSSVNYLESDTVWINPNKSTSSIPHNLSYQDKSSHLYINKICPPEYSELDGQSSFRNINHCSSSQAEIEAGFQRVNIITRIGISWSNILFMPLARDDLKTRCLGFYCPMIGQFPLIFDIGINKVCSDYPSLYHICTFISLENPLPMD